MPKNFTVWYGESDRAARFVIENTLLAKTSPAPQRRRIWPTTKSFVNNPSLIQRMLYLDKPDVVVTLGDPEQPVVGIEFCSEAPTGHDIYQRFARVVAAAELGTPFAYVFPRRKFVARKGGGRWDEYNPLALQALLQVGRFHNVPVLGFLWYEDEQRGKASMGRLLCDDIYTDLPSRNHPEIKALWQFVNMAIEYAQNNEPFSRMVFSPFYGERERIMWQAYSRRRDLQPEWSPLTSREIVRTSQLTRYLRRFGLQTHLKLPPDLSARRETVIYRNEPKTFRGDPYAGALAALDYLECRAGPTKDHRFRNLAVHFSNTSIADLTDKAQRYYTHDCPLQFAKSSGKLDRYYMLHLREGCRYTKQKEIRIFGWFADIIIFKDAVLF